LVGWFIDRLIIMWLALKD